MSRFPGYRGVIGLVALLIGALLATSAAPGWLPYRIQRGDSLWSLAVRHHTTVATLKRENGLTGDKILAGDWLSLPGPGVGAVPAACAGGGTGEVVHRVRPGENATVVARRYHVTLAALARRNGLHGVMKIIIGQRLAIPGSRSATAARSCATPPTATVKAMIRAEAARWGVDPALALAVGSVESSFNQAAVSSVGAVGVMQLMPRTAAWLGTMIGRPIDRRVAADNITAGVAFLHFLLSAADDRRTAVAGYYQGLRSVRQRGMYSDTVRYVNNVLDRRTRYV